MNLKRCKLVILPLDDLHLGAGRQRGNLMPCLPYIPGRAVRGALAGWAIRNGLIKDTDEHFLDIFGETDKNGYRISYPFCRYKGYMVPPLSLFEVKGKAEDVRKKYIAKKGTDVCTNLSIEEWLKREEKGPIDFLRRDKWPSDITEYSLKKAGGLIESKTILSEECPMGVRLHSPHDPNAERVGKGGEEGGLFGQEILPRARPQGKNDFEVFYEGELVFEDTPELTKVIGLLSARNIGTARVDFSKVRDIWDEAEPRDLIFIGRRRVPAMVLATTPTEVKKDSEISDAFTVTFTSDIKPFNGPTHPLDFKEVFRGFCDDCERRFSAPAWVSGWQIKETEDGRKTGGSRQVEGAVAAGSCALLQKSSTCNSKELLEKAAIGIGKDTRNGFGRFEINHSVHNLKEESNGN